jgi:hypothetical protein
MQSLGSGHAVATDCGCMYRIDAKDTDAWRSPSGIGQSMRDLLVCQRMPKADLTLRSRMGILQLRHHFRSRAHRAFLEHLHEVQKRRSTPLQPERIAV